MNEREQNAGKDVELVGESRGSRGRAGGRLLLRDGGRLSEGKRGIATAATSTKHEAQRSCRKVVVKMCIRDDGKNERKRRRQYAGRTE